MQALVDSALTTTELVQAPRNDPPMVSFRRDGLRDVRPVGNGKSGFVYSAFCPRAGKYIAYKEAKESGEEAVGNLRKVAHPCKILALSVFHDAHKK